MGETAQNNIFCQINEKAGTVFYVLYATLLLFGHTNQNVTFNCKVPISALAYSPPG